MRVFPKTLLQVGAGLVLGVASIAIGADCFHAMQFLYVSTTNAPPCTTILVCEDGDACLPPGNAAYCHSVPGARLCAKYLGQIGSDGLCSKTGDPTSIWTPGTGPDAGLVLHQTDGPKCTRRVVPNGTGTTNATGL